MSALATMARYVARTLLFVGLFVIRSVPGNGALRSEAVIDRGGTALRFVLPGRVIPERLNVDRSPDLRALYARVGVNDGDDFVTVEPVGADVRVRVVRVTSINDWCSRPLVQAVERTFPRTTVQAVAGLRVCAISNRRVETALKRAPSHEQCIDFFGSIDGVVANCGPAEKEFVFAQPPLVDHKLLSRQSPDVAALWHLGERIRAVAMGSEANDPFARATPEIQAARDALGTSMVPELLAGKYATYLKRRLTDYSPPPADRGPRWVEVVERPSLNLATYVEPVMPPIAMSAGVLGDVRLKITADSATGLVTQVDPLEGSPPLLVPSAMAAVRAWRFTPGAAPVDPLDVTVRFRLRCP